MALCRLVVVLLLVACSGPRTAPTTSAPSAAVSSTPSVPPASPQSASPSPQAVGSTPRSFNRISFADGVHEGTVLKDQRLELGASPTRGSYEDPYGGGIIADERGTWTSDPVKVPFIYDQLIASWNAMTPPGTWIEVEVRASGGARTTRWYPLAIWAAGDDTIHRTTARGVSDADGKVNVDTLEVSAETAPRALEVRLTLHRVAGRSAAPSVGLLAVTTSGPGDHLVFLSRLSSVVRDLDVPTLSQETHTGHFLEYDGGGEAWCSPTSTAMVLAYWKTGPSATDLAAFPGSTHGDGSVDHAARYVYDWSYRGAGNWPFNTAYAAGYGLETFITRLRSLAEAEKFIEAGIPLVASISGTLPGFLFTSTSGHLLVIRGFAANGDVIVNDPAVRANAQARKVYPRADFERVWLGGSSGTVYVIHPAGVRLPANVPDRPANW